MFASDLDAASRRQLDRGARLVELLKQPQYSPFPVADQVISVWAGTNGQFDDVPVQDVLRFERELLDYLKRSTSIVKTLAETNKWDDDTAAAVTAAIKKFKQQFTTSEGQVLGTADNEQHLAPLTEDDVDNEAIQVQKRS